MTPKLWGRASSVNVQKVMWALAELGLDHERIDAGGTYGRIDEVARVNPNRRVPVWQEDGWVLWESHAILRHLAARGIPHDPVADQWMEWTTSTLQPPFIGMFWQMVRMRPEDRSAEALTMHTKALNVALGILDERLGTTQWLNGNAFSTAELAAGSLMYRLNDIDWPKGGFLHVATWYDRLAERPAYRANVMTSYDELRAG